MLEKMVGLLFIILMYFLVVLFFKGIAKICLWIQGRQKTLIDKNNKESSDMDNASKYLQKARGERETSGLTSEENIYKKIENSSDAIIDNLNGHVEDYNWLKKNLHKKNVSEDVNYQNKYRKFWVIRYISKKSAFHREYFSYLENNK